MALHNTEKAIEDLESSLGLDQSDDHLAQRTIQTKRDRNSLIPINQLPPEILISIFHTLLFSFGRINPYRNHLYQLKAISSVSWWWNTIIMDAAVLWAVIESRTPTDLLPVVLRRSRDCPLEITLDELGNRNRDFEFSLGTVFSNINRWKMVSIDLETATANRRERLEYPSPTIEVLDLKIHKPWKGPQVNIFRGHAPTLTKLRIQGLPVRWSPGVFQGLRKIIIRRVLENGPTTTEILDALRCSPQLQHLELVAVSMPSTPPPHYNSPVQLEHLKSLLLSELPSSATQDTLAQIRAPNLLQLSVQPFPIDPNYHLTTFFDIALRHFIHFISSCIKSTRELRLGVASHTPNIFVRTRPQPGKEFFIIDLNHTPVTAGLEICDALFLAHATPLPLISLEVSTNEDVPETEFLWMFDNEINDKVTEINMRRSNNSSFLSFLCTGRKVDGIWKWPFPRLKRLALPYAGLSPEQAVSLIRQRYAPTSADFPKDLVPYSRDATFELVDRLKCLDAGWAALMPDHRSYLPNIVGDDVLQGYDDWSSDYLDDEV